MSSRKSYILGFAFALVLSVGILFAAPALAQEIDLEAFGQAAGFTTSEDIVVIIARLIRTAISLTGIIAVVLIIYGGFKYMTAGGDQTKIQSAKKILTNALIGLIIVFASFAITQFILNSLVEATSPSISSTSPDYSFGDGNGAGLFYLSSVNTDCSESLQNLQLQFVFSKRVDDDTVDDGILITDSTDDLVDGSFDVSGRVVTFTPTQACDSPYEAYNCFDADEDYTIELDSTQLKATDRSSLTCLTAYPCSFSFTTGTGVDINDPTVEMDAPEDGASIIVTYNELLQAETTDDTGVSTTYFYVIDDDEAVYSSGVDFSSKGALTGGDAVNYFFTDSSEEWDSTGYTTNEEYRIWAKGVDCAGNSDTASAVEIVLRALNCDNGILDSDYEDEIDCGGDSTSPYYCGACDGGACSEHSDCSSGRCEDGVCVSVPKIDSISPGDGTAGNLVTIAGEGFGDSEGVVTFLGTESGDEIAIGAYECNSVTQWEDEQIIVEIPAAAVDGPILVETGDAIPLEDRSDDDYGVTIVDFDVNAIARPGICMLDPSADEPGEAIDVFGNSFGSTQGSSTMYFTNYETSSYVTWTDAELTVVIPNVNSGYYNATVYTGDFVCLDVLGDPTAGTCSNDDDCGVDETCASTWCSETLDYCDEDDDCGDSGGSCESIRVGSNEVRFTVSDISSDTVPLIASVDTGWKACGTGSDEGDQCATDDDCDGTCEDASNWGPSGQYVTVYGTNFGTATGIVVFENNTLGDDAWGDDSFPDYCSDDFWHDTYITVKVPEVYIDSGVDLEFITHDLYIQRPDAAVSEPVDFVVIDDEPGPSICDIDPSAGPEGTEVTVYGERFGSTDGDVTFYNEVDASNTIFIWDDEDIADVFVPSGAVTGPAYVVTSEGYESNSFTFAVGNCNEDADLCEEGDECCANGTCSSISCLADEDVESHYAYRISTATIPNAPQVVVECDLGLGIISPSVWEGWTDAEDTCLNVAVTATFNMKMKTASLITSNVTVEKCTLNEEEDDPEADPDDIVDSCVTWTAITASGFSATVLNFNWYPPLNESDIPSFDADSWYRVTLNGGGEAGDIQAHVDEGGAYMERNFEWEFSTAATADLCEVGDVNVTPAQYTETEENVDVAYLAQLIAASDDCQVLACTGYTLSWSSSDAGAVIDTAEPGSGVCTNVVRAEKETPAGDPAEIEAEVTNTNSSTNPVDDASLIINFLDPEVDDFFPDCSTACINALPFAAFNTGMDWGTIVSSMVSTSTVELYECEDSLCETSELTSLNSTLVSSVTQNSGKNRLEINFNALQYLSANTWYRIVLDGDAITSQSDVPLSLSGSNYGSEHNQYYEDDFSWKFKTKDSDVTCSVDSVEVSPSPAIMSYVGEREEFNATAYGAPDDCDVDGQALQGSSYTWNVWTAVDDPNNFGVDEIIQSDVVAYMLDSGDIELTQELPAWCSASCLNVGSAVQFGDAVCGDGFVDLSAEECDDGNTNYDDFGDVCDSGSDCDSGSCTGGLCDGDGCSSVCLLEGSAACAYACDLSGEACSSDPDCAETCEEGVCTISGDPCATDDGSDCPYYSGDTCEISTAPCCGDGSVISNVEECDDGGSTSGDGCSSSCLNEGSNAVGSTCGDSSTDHANATGGEDCDDGNTNNGDGCSSQCLFEGGTDVNYVYATCGNTFQEDGEDCDDGNIIDNDGCSSICLNEGTVQCVLVCSDGGSNCSTDDDCPTAVGTCNYYNPTCCGNSTVDDGEDCDGGTSGAEGCSDECLLEGSSAHYTIPSYCGDGDDTGVGEECDADSSETFATSGYGVGEVADGAPLEVDSEGYAYSTITATADGVPGEATLALECSCTTDDSCDIGAGNLGCGLSNCCFERPTVGDIYPANNIVAGVPVGAGHCRNTAVYAEFSAYMDLTTLDPTEYTDGSTVVASGDFEGNFYLDLISAGGTALATGTPVADESTCPETYTRFAYGPQSSGNIFVRAWNWITDFVFGFFGAEATASSSYRCMMPVSYEGVEIDDEMRIYIRYTQLLEENAEYRLVIFADDDATDSDKEGIISENDVTLCIGTTCQRAATTRNFYVGDEVCELEYVGIKDVELIGAPAYLIYTAGYFTEEDEEHEFLSTPYTYRESSAQYEEISPLASIYDWDWAWGSDTEDTDVDDIVGLATGDLGDDTSTNYTASGNDGDEQILATATITVDVLFDPSTEDSYETGTFTASALLCENTWPALDSALGFPYVETLASTNFSFYYCRDAGEDGTDDDLPALEDPIDVTSLSSAGILQELIFKVEDSSDAIGVRVIPNEEYLSATAWVEEQGFTGNFSSTELDGYNATESGTTLYAAAANQDNGSIYSNIYIISYNDNADDEASTIFEEILENWEFNANDTVVTDVNLCSVGPNYVITEDDEYISCDWDGGCYETCETESLTCQEYDDAGDSCDEGSDCDSEECTAEGVCQGAFDVGEGCTVGVALDACESAICSSTCTISGDECVTDIDCPLAVGEQATCDAQKDKLTRDMNRLTDLTDMISTIDGYGENNMHCSVTKEQTCTTDSGCPGTEECIAGYPDVQSGTFVPAISNSIWASWNAVLANDLGTTLPTDPVNEFYNCVDDGYDEESCWNGAEGTFVCPANSHLYAYQSAGGEAYTLYAMLESSTKAIWDGPIDLDSDDDVTVVAEYVTGNAPSGTLEDGFELSPLFCDATTWGDSEICGDGVQGATETCELGDTDVIDCTDGSGDDGVMTVACLSDCTGFQNQIEAEGEGAVCSPYACGNGVIEDLEECDDGALNGSYGYCGDDCTTDSAFYCGDGYLAASETCDCGTTLNYDTLITDGSSWTVLGEDGSGFVGAEWCATSNGQYTADITVSCAYNCTQPGPSCGDGEVNGDELCDGDYEEHAGGLCADNATPCDTNSDCEGFGFIYESCGVTYESCGIGDVCADWDDAGDACDSGSDCDSGSCGTDGECESASDIGDLCTIATDCDSGSCPDFDYELFRYRSCENTCEWPSWSACVGGDQLCGNGTIEGNEECDDGNDSNNDACLNTCELNLCGDDSVYVGVESCDNGVDNGELCDADYEGSCNYCNELCQYKTLSGAFCGDGEINGGESCDGDEITYMCFDTSTGEGLTDGSCDAEDDGSQGDCETGYTCRWLGVCNGGTDNGDPCTLNPSDPTGETALTGSDAESCSGGSCVAPTCDDNCGSQCPFAYETTGLLVVSELEGAEPTDSLDLYSYQNDSDSIPDNAAIYIPACLVATTIKADINNDGVIPPDVDIIFITDLSGSMDDAPGGGSASVGSRRIDYVVEATKDAIEDLYDAYTGTGAVMKIGLVSYTTSYWSGTNTSSAKYDFCNSTTSLIVPSPGVEGAWQDNALSTSGSESSLVDHVDEYANCVCDTCYGGSSSGGTPTYKGVERALSVIGGGSGDVQIIVLLSDGDPTYDEDYYVSGDGDECDGHSESYQGNSYVDEEACVASIVEDFLATNPNVIFYSAALTTSSRLKGYMAHISSNECEWDETSSGYGVNSTSDCNGSYAFNASSEEEIEEMYEAIVNSILGTTLSLTTTDEDGDTTTTSGEVLAGSSVAFPFPEGFVCQDSEQIIPLRNTFYGTGPMFFSNFELTYCPYE